MDPREILLPEIWELVFDKVEVAQDWLNLYRASPSFQEIVGGKRTTALFPQVFHHVFDYLEEDLNLNEILELRLVCRKWKPAVDKMLENSVTVDPYHQDGLEAAYDFQDSARISSFLKRFDSHAAGKNPFVGRFASFKFGRRRDLSSKAKAEYNDLTTRLLNKFGAQLKTLCVDMLLTNFDDCASRIQSILDLTPNLNSLRFHVEKKQRGEGEVIPYIERGPLPLLRNLKSIWLTANAVGARARGVLLDLQNAVVRLSCNPNSLESINTTGIPSELLLPFPNVKSAEVELLELEDYSNLARSSWPLSSLTVTHSFEIPLEPLFQSIEHFKATLTSLKLERPLLQNRNLNLRLDLPHLKELQLEENPNMSLHFLTNLANLEVLTISCGRHMLPNYRRRRETNYLLTLLEWAGDEVDQCDLWDGLPKLTQISLIGPFTQQFVRRTFVVNVLRHVATRDSREFQRLKKQRCFTST